MYFSFLDTLYALSPDGAALIKAGIPWYAPDGTPYRYDGDLWKIAHGTTRTDKKGKVWYFNGPTKRWRRQKTKDRHPNKRSHSIDELLGEEGDIRRVQGQEYQYTAGTWKAVEAIAEEAIDIVDEMDEWRRSLSDSDPELASILDAVDRDNSEFDSKVQEVRDFADVMEQSSDEMDAIASEFEGYRSGKQRPTPGDESAIVLKPKNQIVAFPVNRQRKLTGDITGQMTELRRLAEAFNEEAKQREDMDRAMGVANSFIAGIQDAISGIDDLLKHHRQGRTDRLERMLTGKLKATEARVAAMSKRTYELLNPTRKIVVPKGTTQMEYLSIVMSLNRGDKEAIARYTAKRSKSEAQSYRRRKDAALDRNIAYGKHLDSLKLPRAKKASVDGYDAKVYGNVAIVKQANGPTLYAYPSGHKIGGAIGDGTKAAKAIIDSGIDLSGATLDEGTKARLETLSARVAGNVTPPAGWQPPARPEKKSGKNPGKKKRRKS